MLGALGLFKANGAPERLRSSTNSTMNAPPGLFHRLPLEIRLMIYEYIFPPDFQIFLNFRCDLHGQTTRLRLVYTRNATAKGALRAFHTLSLIGGQILEETAPLFWAGAHFVLDNTDPSHLRDNLKRIFSSKAEAGFWKVACKIRRMTIRTVTGFRRRSLLGKLRFSPQKGREWFISFPMNHRGERFFEVYVLGFMPEVTRLWEQERWLCDFLLMTKWQEGLTRPAIEKILFSQVYEYISLPLLYRAISSKAKLDQHNLDDGNATGQMLSGLVSYTPMPDNMTCPSKTPWWNTHSCVCLTGRPRLTGEEMVQRYGTAEDGALIGFLHTTDRRQAQQLKHMGGALPAALAAYRAWNARR